MAKLQAKDVYGKIKHTFINYAIKACQDEMETKELAHLISNADWSRMPDYVLTDEEIIDYVDWRKVNPYQALRSAARYRDVSSKIPLEIYEFKVDGVLSSLKINPGLINRININYEKANRSELMQLCLLGKEEVLEHIDLGNYELKTSDRLKILKIYEFSQLAIDKTNILGAQIKDRYTTKELLLHTGIQIVELLDTELLSPQDWINVLRIRPELIGYINEEVFLKGDVYYLVLLSLLFPQYLKYFDEDKLGELSSLGWEKLIIKYPEKFLHLCSPSNLEISSWSRIKRHHPNLVPS